jgi:hypothetical protein
MLDTENSKNLKNGNDDNGNGTRPAEISRPEKRVEEIIYLKRCKLRWSQQELADYANRFSICFLSQQRVARIEQGAKILWVEGCAIASAMGLSLDELRP